MADTAETTRPRLSFGGLLLALDGTLVDTAPDMVRVLDTLCDECGVARVAYERARNQISNGVYALLGIMLFCSLMGLAAALYVLAIDRREGP